MTIIAGLDASFGNTCIARWEINTAGRREEIKVNEIMTLSSEFYIGVSIERYENKRSNYEEFSQLIV
jgi:hypothetical protein